MIGLFPIPDTWSWRTLGEISEVVGGVTKDSKKQSDPELPLVPYLRVANVQRGHLDLNQVAEIRVPVKTLDKLRLQRGDVLLNEGGDRDKLGRGWIWENQIDNCIHQNHVFRSRILNNAMRPKLLAWFTNECAKSWFWDNATQSVNLASISLSTIKSLPIPVPPIHEQESIESAIDSLLSRIDVGTSFLASSALRLTALRKRLIIDATEFRPTEGWTLSRLDAVAEVRLGRQRSPKHHSGTHMRPYLRAANVGWEGLKLGDVKEMNFTDAEAKVFHLEPGDLLLSEASGSPGEVGKPAYWNGEIDDCCFQNTLIRVRAHTIDPKYLFHFLYGEALAGNFGAVTQGVNIHHLGASRLSAWTVPIPPAAVQTQIVDRLEESLAATERVQESLVRNQIRSAALRQSVLMRAFAGELLQPNEINATDLAISPMELIDSTESDQAVQEMLL
ncbi:restriction endonuclease subunit S [Nocardia asteroides]|uniref:restriction endonuclease subunit S n=1 Tax=Nocardia asteroides TaxID=1824 RepID=UPI00344860E5